MPYAAVISGLAIPLLILLGRHETFQDGYAFDKPLHLSIPLLLLAFLIFGISGLATLYQVIVRKRRPWWLLALVLVVATWWGQGLIHIPGFKDGMEKKIRDSSITEQEFLDFARDCRAARKPGKNEDSYDREYQKRLIGELKIKHSKIIGLARWEPRVSMEPDYVTVFWGSGLVNFYGVRISESEVEPMGPSEKDSTRLRRLFPRVWLYYQHT